MLSTGPTPSSFSIFSFEFPLQSNTCELVTVDPFHAELLGEELLLYAIKIAFPASLLNCFLCLCFSVTRLFVIISVTC